MNTLNAKEQNALSPGQTLQQSQPAHELAENISKVLYTPAQLADIVKRLGAQISNDYKGLNLLLICVLKGALHFFSDLSRAVTIRHEVEFMQVRSYHGSSTSGTLELVQDFQHDKNTHVLIVDEMCDTGRTFSKITELMKGRGFLSVKTCTLLDKPARRQIEFECDYVGERIENCFVVGYGMDWQELYRNIPFVGVLKKELTEREE